MKPRRWIKAEPEPEPAGLIFPDDAAGLCARVDALEVKLIALEAKSQARDDRLCAQLLLLVPGAWPKQQSDCRDDRGKPRDGRRFTAIEERLAALERRMPPVRSPPSPGWLPVKQAAQPLCRSEPTVYAWARTGKIASTPYKGCR